MRSEIAGLTIGFVKSDSTTRRYASMAAVHADERRAGETSLRTSVERAVGRCSWGERDDWLFRGISSTGCEERCGHEVHPTA